MSRRRIILGAPTQTGLVEELRLRIGEVGGDFGTAVATQAATSFGTGGVRLLAARDDHKHPYLIAPKAMIQPVSPTTSTAGVAEYFPRGDHVHFVDPGAAIYGAGASNVSITTSTGGIAPNASRGDHVHYFSHLAFITGGSTDQILVKSSATNYDTKWTRNLLLSSLGTFGSPVDLPVDCGAQKTIELVQVVYDDVRITPGAFDRPGSSDPAIVLYYPNAGAIGTYLYEFAKNNFVSFAVQIPHGYKTGSDISVHVHWTPGPNGAAENGKTVGWKVDYSWANIDGTFGDMQTADLSDACDGTNHKHQMTPEVVIDGHTAAKHISSMLICNLRRTDTGADDTWTGTLAGALPMILEVDFHFPIDTIGSRQAGAK